jgi:hypothetical protein
MPPEKHRKAHTVNTITYDDISLDWHPWGVTVSALVTDAYNSAPWVESLQIVPWNECESDNHEMGVCDCPPDGHYLDTYQQHLTANQYRLIDWPEQ